MEQSTTHSSGAATILHSTFTDNETIDSGGGLSNITGGTLVLESSIVTGNRALSAGNEVIGTITQVGINLIGDDLFVDGSVNTSDIDETLLFDGSLDGRGIAADHGGPVKTVAPGPLDFSGAQIDQTDDLDLDRDGDVAEVIDTAANGVFRDPSLFPTLGAHEVSNRLVVTTLSNESFTDRSLTEEINDGDGLSLIEAIAFANTTDADEEIVFAPELMGGTIFLGGTTLEITDTLSIDGDIDGDGKADITLDGGGHETDPQQRGDRDTAQRAGD